MTEPGTAASRRSTTTPARRGPEPSWALHAGALGGVKSVKATDGDELEVLNTRALEAGCVPDADGFYVGGCVPVMKPGSDETWRMAFTNTGFVFTVNGVISIGLFVVVLAQLAVGPGLPG